MYQITAEKIVCYVEERLNDPHSNANTFNGVITIKELIEVLEVDSEAMQKMLIYLREKKRIARKEISSAKNLVKELALAKMILTLIIVDIQKINKKGR